MNYLRLLSIVAVLSLFFYPVYAQQTFEINIETRDMSKGEQVSYMVDIPQAKLETVEKNWIKLLQDETKEKAVITDHEIYIEGAMAKEIIQKPINIYSYVYELDSSVRIYSFFEVDSVFFAYSGSENDIAGEKMLHGITNFKRKFATDQFILAVSDEVKLEEETLKLLMSDLKKLQKDNEDYQKEIQECEQNISESNDELSLLDADNQRLMESITAKRAEVSSISDKDLKKEENKVLKGLESDKKKVGNKIEKERKKIVEYESKIALNEKSIEKNLELQKLKDIEIELQEDVLNNVIQKLDGIK